MISARLAIHRQSPSDPVSECSFRPRGAKGSATLLVSLYRYESPKAELIGLQWEGTQRFFSREILS